MPQPRPWVEEVADALKELGGKATLNKIYQQIRDRNKMDFTSNPQWDSAVRDALRETFE